MYLTKTPWWIKFLYPSLTWKKNTYGKPVIYLTFDDGPIPEVTPFVLTELKKVNAKATFFCIGDNVRKYATIYEQIIADGHSVGSHTFNHLNGWKTQNDHYLENIIKSKSLIRSDLFRPPYGRIKCSQIHLIKKHLPNLQIVMWDVLSGDFDQKCTPKQCYNNIINNVQHGSIVVFHDSLKAFKRLEYALPQSLNALSKLGYHFEALNF